MLELSPIARLSRWAAFLLALGLLALCALLIYGEQRWLAYNYSPGYGDDANRTAFYGGSIGTEFIPLPALLVLPELDAAGEGHFFPEGDRSDPGAWIENFGFIRRSDEYAAESGPYAALPVGFTVSHYQPGTALPSPTPFVGLGCAACHTTEIYGGDNKRRTAFGGGANMRLDLIAWGEAFRSILLATEAPDAPTVPAGPRPGANWKVTADAIFEAYEGHADYPPLTILDKLVIQLWLGAIRGEMLADLGKYDEPFGGALLRDALHNPIGPTRTAPFRSLTRIVMDRPGTSAHFDNAFSKIATVLQQARRDWAQFDGSVFLPNSRSAMASMTAGATQSAFLEPSIVANVVGAANYTLELDAPGLGEVFPEARPRLSDISAGAEVYASACATCHGLPVRGGGWTATDGNSRLGELIRLSEIGTDPQRVEFRHAERATAYLYEYFAFFPKGHPFRFTPDQVRPAPGTPKDEALLAYIAQPLESVWVRAPYLHNGSVPTIAQLVGLDCRPSVFWRGRNTYDPTVLGLSDSAAKSTARYFRFDTSLSGNSNAGHDYLHDPDRCGPALNDEEREERRVLVEYLKTF